MIRYKKLEEKFSGHMKIEDINQETSTLLY